MGAVNVYAFSPLAILSLAEACPAAKAVDKAIASAVNLRFIFPPHMRFVTDGIQR